MPNQYIFHSPAAQGHAAIKSWTNGVHVEDKAMQQLRNLASLPFVQGHVAAMPDVHWGMGATVGSVFATKGAIIPAAVGVDIGCVDKDTEFLSPSGWIKLSEYQGEEVCQYDLNTGEASFTKPLTYIKRPSEGFIHFKTKYGIDQKLSLEHRMLLCEKSSWEVLSAHVVWKEHKRLKLGFRRKIPVAPEEIRLNTELTWSEAELRVMVMLCADGSLYKNGGKARISFKKLRKIERARKLLQEAAIEVSHEREANGITSLTFTPPENSKDMGFIWKASKEQLAVIAEEVLYWDGNSEEKCFYTSIKSSADAVQYAFIASGYSARIFEDERKGSKEYRVYRREMKSIGIAGSPKTEFSFVPSEDGYEYCFKVPSSFFVIRRNGCVAITGNCGMCAAMTSLTAKDLPDNLHKIRTAIEASVPHGRTDNGGPNDRGAWGEPPVDVAKAFAGLHDRLSVIGEKHPKLDRAVGRAMKHLGTLGTGNHFIEVCLDEVDRVWVMLHSGSRGIGNAIGTYFINRAKEEMRRWFINLPDEDLAYFAEGSVLFDDYVEAVGWAQDYAMRNREVMLTSTLHAIKSALGRDFEAGVIAVNCHHNYVTRERHLGQNVWLTRKGAVRAREGDLGIIPGSMGTRSYIVRGKGNKESFHSCSHGAGRAMSRAEARRQFTLEDHAKATEGVECRKDEGVIDETPAAYKSIDAVMEAQKDLVEVVHTLKQVVCVKG